MKDIRNMTFILPRKIRSNPFKGRGQKRDRSSHDENLLEKKDDSHMHVILPSGLKISAGGEMTILIIGVVSGLIFCCERITRLMICICERLNHQPEDPRRR
mgnify:CR=1 FL=1